MEGVAVGEEGGWEGDPEKYGEWLEVDEGGKKRKRDVCCFSSFQFHLVLY